MKCAKCGHDNPESFQFCAQCHQPLRFTCPVCKHVQDHGDECEQCGVNFAKYAAMLVFQNEMLARQARARDKSRNEVMKQIFLLPITGGLSLLKFLKNLRGGE